MVKKYIAYIDGKNVALPLTAIEAFTPGVFAATGIFETLRADKEKVRFIDDHLGRLRKGLAVLKMKNPLSPARWHEVSVQCLLKNKIKSARLRWMVWKEGKTIHHAILVLPYKAPIEKIYQQGIKVCLIATQRAPSSRLAFVKSLDYTLFKSASDYAKAKGFDDALLINAKGQIFESTKANIMALVDGQMMTPPLASGCLAGLTRQRLIDMGGRLGMPVKEVHLTPNILNHATAVVLTNSLMGVMPINLTHLRTQLKQPLRRLGQK